MHPRQHVRHVIGAIALAALAVAVAGGTLSAQETGEIRGTVLSAAGEPVADARVRLVGLGRAESTGPDGRFAFEGIRPGTYLLEVESPREGYSVERVTVVAGRAAEIESRLTHLYHGDAIVVTAAGARQATETFQATKVIGAEELRLTAEASLGETLKGEPGINATYFGPGASRPVIRGLGGDRIRILERGVGTGDASSTSPDHAVGVEPVAVERIEVVRGPATLLYGSSAIGGVVNVIDRRIPTELPARSITGTVQGRGGTVADERNGAAELNGAFGRVAWHLSGLVRETEDFDIPGFAEAEGGEEEGEGPGQEEEEAFGTLPNSFVETLRGAAGLSYVGERGYLGASFTTLDSKYGIPGHGPEEEAGEEVGGEEEEGAAIDLLQRRIDLEGEWRFAGGFFERLKARFGISDYRHFELEGDEIGTTFENDEWELRVEGRHAVPGVLEGALGVQVRRRDFSAIGEEAFVPPTETDQIAVFLFEELGDGPVRFQTGARLEHQNTTNLTEGIERDESGISASLGLMWDPSPPLTFVLSGSRAVKLPTAEELFSDGPHLATDAFEIGDPNLDAEVGYSLDASARLTRGPVRGSFTFFVNRYDDFIFQEFTGEEEEGLRVLVYAQDDALFRGYELEAEVDLFHHDTHDHHLLLDAWSDYVRAELTATDEPLPRIPPLRLGSGLRYEGNGWTGRAGLTRVTEQDRVGRFEEPTAGYTMLDASVGYRFFTSRLVHEVTLKGANLTNEEARNHVSFLKEVAPLPGRELRLTYSISF